MSNMLSQIIGSSGDIKMYPSTYFLKESMETGTEDAGTGDDVGNDPTGNDPTSTPPSAPLSSISFDPTAEPPPESAYKYEDLMELIKEALNIAYDVQASYKDDVVSTAFIESAAEMISSNQFTTNGGIAVGKHDAMIKTIQKNDAEQTAKLIYYHEYMTKNNAPTDANALAANFLGMYGDAINEMFTPEYLLQQFNINNVTWYEVDYENGYIHYKRELTTEEKRQNAENTTGRSQILPEGYVSFDDLYTKMSHDYIINFNFTGVDEREYITKYYNNVSTSMSLFQLNLVEIVGSHSNLVFEQSNKAIQNVALSFEQSLKSIHGGIRRAQYDIAKKIHEEQLAEAERIAEQERLKNEEMRKQQEAEWEAAQKAMDEEIKRKQEEEERWKNGEGDGGNENDGATDNENNNGDEMNPDEKEIVEELPLWAKILIVIIAVIIFCLLIWAVYKFYIKLNSAVIRETLNPQYMNNLGMSSRDTTINAYGYGQNGYSSNGYNRDANMNGIPDNMEYGRGY